jgi:hypothetical protein
MDAISPYPAFLTLSRIISAVSLYIWTMVNLHGKEDIRGSMHILLSGFLVGATLWIWMQLPIP